MILKINGVDYPIENDVEQGLMNAIWLILVEKYGALSSSVQFAAQLFVREKVLKPMEKQLTAQFGKEIGRACRPPKGGDPVIHAGGLFIPQIREAMSHATIWIVTNESADTISAIALSVENQDQAGGQMALDGHERIGQDHSIEVS